MDKSIILEIVNGRVEPRIYAFLTRTVPRYLKVGDTYRPVPQRIREWEKKGFDIISFTSPWKAFFDNGCYFRDYEVHRYLTEIAKMKRITREELLELAGVPDSDEGDSPYSQEFFRYALNGAEEVTDAQKAAKNVDSAVEDIRRYCYGEKDHALSYSVYDLNGKAEEDKLERVLKEPRENQRKAIEKFVKAVGGKALKKKKLLMYAVMRFGKTFTSLCCAKKCGARLVVVVSAKKDVSSEWENEVRYTKNFEDYEFLDADNLKRNDAILKQIKSKKKSFVVFLTLHAFLKDKEWLNQLFRSRIDLLIVDETHFGARAARLGRVLAEESAKDRKVRCDVDVDDDIKGAVKGEDEVVSQIALNARVKLHLSGTPYRILMRGEFPEEDIVAFCQYADIIDAQAAWDRDHLGKRKGDTDEEYAEWENPYYGFPQMVRFAFNPSEQALRLLRSIRKVGGTYSFAEIFRPAQDEKGEFNGKFAHPKEVEEFVRVLDGSDECESTGFISLIKFLKDNKRDICHHMVMVLPYCASCDAMEALLKSGKFKNLAEYEVLNISGHRRSPAFDDPQSVKDTIARLATGDKKHPPRNTITLTVNRMLTGSTVPEWDTMIFLKDTKSPQEYDQAIFRLQSPYVQTIPCADGGGAGRPIRRNLKPQTLLIDFNPDRMFRMQELKGQVYNDNVGKKGHEQLARRIEKELEVSPIIFLNGDKLKQAKHEDVVNVVREYSGKRGVSEEVLELDVDLDCLAESDRLASLIANESELDAREGMSFKTGSGPGDDFNPLAKKPVRPVVPSGKNPPEGEEEEGDDTAKELASRFRNYYRRVLFYAFLIQDEVKTLDDVINSIRKEAKDNLRIATHLGIYKADLIELKKVRSGVLSQFEYSIGRISELAHDEKKEPLERALVAVRRFGRIGQAKIVTPANIAYDMVCQIPAAKFKKMLRDGDKILDIASKMGEFAIAIVRRANELGVETKEIKGSVLSIPMCGITYEFTRKVYDLLGLDPDCIAAPEKLNSYKLLEVKDADGQIDYQKIKRLLTQDKKFKDISTEDHISKKGTKTMCMRVGTVLGNPPYQEMKGEEKLGFASAIYPYFMNTAFSMDAAFVSMITPSRWLLKTGQGINEEWADKLIHSNHFISMSDYHDARECFHGVEIKGGVSYFLYSDDHLGKCSYRNLVMGRESKVEDKLDAFGCGVVVRDEVARSVLKKIIEVEGEGYSESSSFSKYVGPTHFFDKGGQLGSSWKGFKLKKDARHDIKYYLNKRVVDCGFAWISKSDIPKGLEAISLHKVYVPEAYGAGEGFPHQILGVPFYGEPGSVCSQTYLCIGYDHKLTKAECLNIISYIKTRFFRYMVSIKKNTQHSFSAVYQFVPMQDFSEPWTDKKLYEKYRISSDEQKFIESMIKPME